MKNIIEWIKSPKSNFLLLVIALILLNLVCMNSFFRIDLTSNKSYSLCKSSKELVKTLEEPVSVKVFFSKNLPSPYNTVEQYLKDILVEYKQAANKNFSYEFLNMDKEANIELASQYKIRPRQIQEVKDSEVGFKSVYMALAIVYADNVQVIDEISDTSGLEYLLTTSISKLINTTSTLAGLKQNINLTLYLSSNLEQFGINGFSKIQDTVQSACNAVNKKNHDKISFSVVDPSETQIDELVNKYSIDEISWVSKDSSSKGKAVIALVLESAQNFRVLPVGLSRGFFGTYSIAGLENLSETLEENLVSLVSRSTKIGYLSGFGCKDISDEQNGAYRLQLLASDKYEFVELDLQNDEIPASISNIVIAGPTEKISDNVLFKLDQFLMKGGNLTIFADSFKEIPAANQYTLPTYQALDTGLNEFLKKYGITVNSNYVMDKHCYESYQRTGKIPFYYLPVIERDDLNQKNVITKNLSYVLMCQNSSIDVDPSQNADIKTTVLAHTSKDAWVVSDNIILHPMYISIPQADEMQTYNLALLCEGKFHSAYTRENAKSLGVGSSATKASKSKGNIILENTDNNAFLENSIQSGKIFVVGTSAITSSMLLDEEGKQPVSIFVRNVLDYMNGNSDLCQMRTKGLSLNTLRDASDVSVRFAKIFNQYVVPLLVVVVGLIIWRVRVQRRKMILGKYSNTDTRETMKAIEKKEKND